MNSILEIVHPALHATATPSPVDVFGLEVN